MVMPPDPVADLVVAEARLARAALEAFFDAVFRLGRTSELDGGRGGGGVREVVVVVECPLRRTFAGDEQHLDRPGAAGRCAGWDAAEGDIELERSRLTIAHVERGPRGLGERPTPPIDALPRRLRRAAVSRGFGRRKFGIAEQRVRGDRQQITLVSSPQSLPARLHFVQPQPK